mmetsp:Transcript_14542/g.35450  ORF Transcript_14542/g.35450 Transcript_14542/m.35450 type:complete len:242 (+) Transcript_14542:295-1020(+)
MKAMERLIFRPAFVKYFLSDGPLESPFSSVKRFQTNLSGLSKISLSWCRVRVEITTLSPALKVYFPEFNCSVFEKRTLRGLKESDAIRSDSITTPSNLTMLFKSPCVNSGRSSPNFHDLKPSFARTIEATSSRRAFTAFSSWWTKAAVQKAAGRVLACIPQKKAVWLLQRSMSLSNVSVNFSSRFRTSLFASALRLPCSFICIANLSLASMAFEPASQAGTPEARRGNDASKVLKSRCNAS